MTENLPATQINHIEKEVFIPVLHHTDRIPCDKLHRCQEKYNPMWKKVDYFNKWILPQNHLARYYMHQLPEKFYQVKRWKIVHTCYKLNDRDALFEGFPYVKLIRHYDLYNIREPAVSYLIQTGLGYGEELKKMFEKIPSKEKIEEYDAFINDWAKRLLAGTQ